MRLAAPVAICLATCSLAVGQVTVGALDGTRCRSLAATGSLGYDVLRTQMTSPGFQAAAGFSLTIAAETPTLTASYLAGIDILFVGDGSTALSPAEATDVAAWHAAGGALFLISDSSSQAIAESVLAAIGSPHVYGGSACSSGQIGNLVSGDDNALTNGPFGDNRGLSMSMTPARELTMVALTDEVASCSGASTVLAKHDAGAVNGADSGPVLMTSDASFLGLFIDPAAGSLYSPVNESLGLNAFVFLGGGGGGGTIGMNFCMANANSTGVPAVISASGSTAVANNDVVLSVTDLPADAFAYFLLADDVGFRPNYLGSDGNLCLAGTLARYDAPLEIQNSGAGGQVSLAIDLAALPYPAGSVSVMVGDRYNWQCWYRDTSAGGGAATSNFSDAIAIVFD
ncbi:MAG: hypothetical protein AAGI22_00910 [Planctomycetota bacterium]